MARGGRLVEDRADVQAGQPAGIGGRLALGRAEVGRAGDHDVVDRLAQGDLGIAHDLAEDERRDVLGAERLPLVLEDEVGIAHVLLDPRDDPMGLDLGRLLGGVADDDVVAVEEHDRRRDPLALLVGDDDGLAVLVHIRDRRVGRSQVDPVHALETFEPRQELPLLAKSSKRLFHAMSPVAAAHRRALRPHRMDVRLSRSIIIRYSTSREASAGIRFRSDASNGLPDPW